MSTSFLGSVSPSGKSSHTGDCGAPISTASWSEVQVTQRPQSVCSEGSCGDWLWGCVSGPTALSTVRGKGKRVSLHVYTPVQWFLKWLLLI